MTVFGGNCTIIVFFTKQKVTDYNVPDDMQHI